MAKPKIYLITPKERELDGLSLPTQRLIQANSQAQALGFAARTSLAVELAGQDDLVACVSDGVPVENAIDEPTPAAEVEGEEP